MEKIIEDYKIQKKLLIKALVEKDYMEIYQSRILKNDFIIKLGEPRYELHKLELVIARTKLKLEMLQTCIHFQLPLDYEHIDRTLQKEFEKNFSLLKIMEKEIDNVHCNRENQELTRVASELKDIYLSIAEKIHPELYSDKQTLKLWKKVRSAYENKDTVKLKKLHKKIMAEYQGAELVSEEPEKDMKKTVKKMKTKTKTILSEIDSLKKQFPFNEAELLGNEEAVKKFRNDITQDIKNAKELLDNLEKQILEKLPPKSDLLN